MNRAPIIVSIWESAAPISLQRSPITIPIWQSTPVSSHKPYQHSQINAEHIAEITGKLYQAAQSPIAADVAYYVGLWEELHDCHWSYMRSHSTEKSAQCWPEFIKDQAQNRSSCGPVMFLQLGPEVAICSKALKIILKLLDHPNALTFSGAEILAEIYNVMMQRNATSETPTYPTLRDVQEAQGIFFTNQAMEVSILPKGYRSNINVMIRGPPENPKFGYTAKSSLSYKKGRIKATNLNTIMFNLVWKRRSCFTVNPKVRLSLRDHCSHSLRLIPLGGLCAWKASLNLSDRGA
ncbi:uncharacterized protein CLUP02_14504 [Colletotrichum lupini]|uniref:Uncharacterized protein n=1 Tax=Colletotrichum lupini TaxID=145971 RepID=A0A9Q8T4H9_9PEZI|nr:uncharacterized protein CLUP02_14504 [Colletotrichum lupini]UQC88977.1 hypothetical protein CLUP02_14504 [Colletotrichum lupini]